MIIKYFKKSHNFYFLLTWKVPLMLLWDFIRLESQWMEHTIHMISTLVDLSIHLHGWALVLSKEKKMWKKKSYSIYFFSLWRPTNVIYALLFLMSPKQRSKSKCSLFCLFFCDVHVKPGKMENSTSAVRLLLSVHSTLTPISDDGDDFVTFDFFPPLQIVVVFLMLPLCHMILSQESPTCLWWPARLSSSSICDAVLHTKRAAAKEKAIWNI